MTYIQKLCAQPGVKQGIVCGSAALWISRAVSIAPWREISVLSTVATAGTIVASIALIQIAVKAIFDVLGTPCKKTAQWTTKIVTAVPFATFLLNQPVFTHDLGIATVLRTGAVAANFHWLTVAYAVLFIASSFIQTVSLFRNDKSLYL
jgi:hypothetical protein